MSPRSRRRGPGWALATMLLLLGLMGMHGVSGGSHDMAAMPGHSPAVATSLSTAMSVTTEHVLLAAGDLTVRSPLGTQPAMTELCLAVLVAVVGLLTLAGARRRTTARFSSHCVPRAPVSRLLRPPDVVAGLCVSRT